MLIYSVKSSYHEEMKKQILSKSIDLNTKQYDLRKDGNNHRTHGMSKDPKFKPLYHRWENMKKRCFTKTDPSYPRYGGRGITVCERWLKFENFYEDMGMPPSPKHSIDRIKNSGDYTPSNCRWATAKEQANNRRSNKIVIYQGQRYTLAQLAEKVGIDQWNLGDRLRSGWSLERATTEPVGVNNGT